MCLTELCPSSDPAPSGFPLPVRQTSPSTCHPPQTTSSNAAEVEPAPVALQEAQPAPQTAPAEVSWMSLAMEKTRSIQQLFTSRFPRDFGGAAAVRLQAQAQAQAQNPAETPPVAPVQTQAVKKQPSTEAAESDAVKAETVQSRGQAQTVRPSLMAMRQGSGSRELQSSKPNIEPQHTTASQSVCVQANPRTTRSPLHSSVPTDASSQPATQSLAQTYLSSGQQQQPPWTARSLQLKSTSSPSASTTTSITATPPAGSAPGREEREAGGQEKDGGLVSGRRAVWAGSVSEKAAFLEKRGEWTTTSGTKGVCGTSL